MEDTAVDNSTVAKAFIGLGILLGLVIYIVFEIVSQMRSTRKTYWKTHNFNSTDEVDGFVKWLMLLSILLAYFGICAGYISFVAKICEEVIEFWLKIQIPLDQLIYAQLIPMSLLICVPNLKSLAFAYVGVIASMIGLMWTTLCCNGVIVRLPAISEYGSFFTFPTFLTIHIICIEIYMPPGNKQLPTNFLDVCCLLNHGMIGIASLYVCAGILGYLHDGPNVDQTTLLNLPLNDWPIHIVKLCVAVIVFFTFSLQFFICQKIAANAIGINSSKFPKLAKYVVRLGLLITIVQVAIAMPALSALMGLLGAFSFCTLGIVFPDIMQPIIMWRKALGDMNWIVWKNVIICGIAPMIFGPIQSQKYISSFPITE